jgi:hypothetical protein
MTEEQMLAIKERAEEWLFRLPGVTAVGLSRKRIDGQFTDTIAIIVYVEHKRSPDDVSAEQRIPSMIDGIPTDVIEAPESTILQAATTPDDDEYDVLMAGISVSAGGGGHGTICCFARTVASYPRGEGIDVLVTCQHVLHDGGTSVEPGSAHSIGQPDSHGCCESCDFCNRIVAHDRVAAVRSREVDGGVAELKSGVKWSIKVGDTPDHIVGIHRRLAPTDVPFPVWKRGRTTRRTVGEVTDTRATGVAKDSKGRVHRVYRNSLRIESPTPFAQQGDSGAPLMSNDNQLVGLVFSGSPTYASACHIDDVQAQLHIEIRTAQNTSLDDQVVPFRPSDAYIRALTGKRGRIGLPPLPIGTPITDEVILLHDPRRLYAAVMTTAVGREFVQRLVAHRSEIRRIARIPRVIAAWRLFGGAHITSTISTGLRQDQVVVPLSYRGRAPAGSHPPPPTVFHPP